MGLLDHLWDDTVAGPPPDSGLGKLRKNATFTFRTNSGKESKVANHGRSFGEEAAEDAVRVTRSIMIVKPQRVNQKDSPPVSPAGSSPPISPLAEEMDEPRVHPNAADGVHLPPASSSSAATSLQDSGEQLKPPQKPALPPATYVVQLPRDQILRYPPPENAKKFQALTNRSKNRRSCCRRCCCFTFCLLVLLVVAAAVSAGVLYLVFRFKSPKYAVTSLSVKGMNLTSAAPLSPGFDVTIRAENPNSKVGIYYREGSAVNVFYDDVRLSDGVLPVFYQPRKNVTVLQTALTGSDVVLGGTVRTALRNSQTRGSVPLVVRTEAPVKIEVGSVKTWEITVKVKCDVVVDGLNDKAKIVSHDCDYTVRLW